MTAHVVTSPERGSSTLPFADCIGFRVDGPSGVLGYLESVIHESERSAGAASATTDIPAGVVQRMGARDAVLVVRSGRRGSVRFFVPERDVEEVDNGARRVCTRNACALL